MNAEHPAEKLLDPNEIARRIDACRDELAALRKLLKVALTIRGADKARMARHQRGGEK